jgi:hypothetical protein
LGRRLLHATLPVLQLLQEVRIFAVGGLSRRQLALLAELLQRCTSLHELSVSFAPEPSFCAQDLDSFGRCSSPLKIMHLPPMPNVGAPLLSTTAGADTFLSSFEGWHAMSMPENPVDFLFLAASKDCAL